MSGLQAVTSGANPVNIKRGIDKTCAFLVEHLRELSKPVSGTNDIRSVASISAGNDAAIGDMIADALDKVRPSRCSQLRLVMHAVRTPLARIAGSSQNVRLSRLLA